MIRNLDYWQPASATSTNSSNTAAANIVIVNGSNINRNGNAATAASTNSANINSSTTTIIEHVNKNNNNNNEVGFDDKNGQSPASGVVVDDGRQATVIVKMAHDKGERIEVTSEGLLEAEDDLIEEVMVIEESEDVTVTDTKALDASPDGGKLDDDVVNVKQPVATPSPRSFTKSKKQARTTPNTTPSSNSANSSLEEHSLSTTSTPSPDHHARRPMNAFLIFCKKHRPIVREKYPNLENRAITKILGDWWANLDKKEQDPFKSLASNYKDAFLTANPSFKWYKLPAPPLRTLSTRPTNSDRSYGDLLTNGLGAGHKTSTTSSKLDEYEDRYSTEQGLPVHNRRRGMKNNMLFKLADENQMGGLSNLMGGGVGLLNDNNNNKSAAIHGSELGDDVDVVVEENSLSAELPFSNMRNYAAQMQVTPKRKLDVHSEFQAMKRAKKRADYLESTGVVAANAAEDYLPQKTSRACKGKKYMEFFKPGNNKQVQSPPTVVVARDSAVAGPIGNGQGSASVIKRTTVPKQPRIIVQQVVFPHNGYCKPQPLEDDEEEDIITKTDVGASSVPGMNKKSRREVVAREVEVEGFRVDVGVPLIDEDKGDSNGKLFDASDFELDSKIGALPALSLDTYLTRKRETKKKKKIGKGKSHARKQANANNNHNNNGPTIQEVKEAMQKVGSQKRKARKESITRRDVNSANATTLDEDQSGEGNASDLLILATLATGEISTPSVQ